jgi:hypothetical protein
MSTFTMRHNNAIEFEKFLQDIDQSHYTEFKIYPNSGTLFAFYGWTPSLESPFSQKQNFSLNCLKRQYRMLEDKNNFLNEFCGGEDVCYSNYFIETSFEIILYGCINSLVTGIEYDNIQDSETEMDNLEALNLQRFDTVDENKKVDMYLTYVSTAFNNAYNTGIKFYGSLNQDKKELTPYIQTHIFKYVLFYTEFLSKNCKNENINCYNLKSHSDLNVAQICCV